MVAFILRESKTSNKHNKNTKCYFKQEIALNWLKSTSQAADQIFNIFETWWKLLYVQIVCSGICHSDLHQWENVVNHGSAGNIRFTDNPGYKFPFTPGHEIAGIVQSLGADVDEG